MATYILLALVVLAFLYGARGMLKHFRGEGACCGGGGIPAAPKKALKGKVIGEKVLHIEGMHCVNCKNYVERMLDGIDGASAKVDLDKKTATLSMERMVDDAEIHAVLDKTEYKLTSIDTAMA